MEGLTLERALLLLGALAATIITIVNWGFLTGRFVQKVEGGREPADRTSDAPERRHIERGEFDRELADAEGRWATALERSDREVRKLRRWRHRLNNALMHISVKVGVDLSHINRDEED